MASDHPRAALKPTPTLTPPLTPIARATHSAAKSQPGRMGRNDRRRNRTARSSRRRSQGNPHARLAVAACVAHAEHSEPLRERHGQRKNEGDGLYGDHQQ